MNNNFDNGFANFRICTELEHAFVDNKESDHYSIIWVTEGMADLLVDGILVPLDANQMTFITPQKEIEITENHCEAIILQFNRAFYCIRENDHEISCEGILYFGAKGVPIIDLVNNKQMDSFSRLIGVLNDEFEIVDTIQEEMLRVVLKKWLIKSIRIVKIQQQFIGIEEPKAELLRQFNILLEQNYRKFHQVNDYAKLLNKSPKTITNQFKILGLNSPSKMIQQRIILEAKRYLMYSNLSIKEISFQLGFDNSSAFSNYFKNRTSLTPGRFKESVNK